MIEFRLAAIEAAGHSRTGRCIVRPVAGLIMLLFLVRFLGSEADQGPVIGRDGRRGLRGPKAPIRDRPSYHHGGYV